ncbi:mycobactin polyketide synthase MbtD [Mycobacterium paraseoulense]|uniref:Polyketide synthase n=1 Tax=Mycobacterium paraseoulense TaxID=590652 RepID=A0A1X0IFY6_9MYCO|nr:mycobactin polyketide synthase MbtD [Mycobacterium paraseoulense]MCV7396092.1 mycobactin polyketide synthase MbtD [Mycobacterium paraseoulense]ORB45882.1 polyketide synthase [Mycobacterium paraseoulense]BBZ70871.1 polyketide synthase [Mycobacterium paraseoulense]
MLTSPLPDGRVPVLLTAHDEELIADDARAILDYLDRTDADTAAIASSLLRLRRVRRHRAVLRAANRAELTSGLSALAHGDEHPLVTRSSIGAAPCIAFVFPGQGNQWQSMGAEAYQRLPAYRAEADRCAQAFLAAGLPSPLPYLTEALDRDWSRTEIQGAQFTHAVSLAHEWRFHGVLPAITIGHSLGEVAAAYVAGTISLPDAAALVGARATIVDQLAGQYAMVVLGAGVDEAESLVGETAGWLEVSAVNGPSSTVVSGDHDAAAAAVRLARQRGMFTHQLSVDYPGHTSVLRPLRAQLSDLVPRSAFQDSPVRFVGSTFGGEVGSDVDFGQYWYENLCNTVRFDWAVTAARRLGATTYVELSAHPALLYPLADLIDERTSVAVGSGHREGAITDVLAKNIATVATADPGCQWANTIPGGARRPLRGFPNAPMRAVHLWAAPEPLMDTVPAPSLTVAVETWQPATPSNAVRADIGVFGATGAETALTQRLIDAVGAQGGCRVVSAREAEIVAVIAPGLDERDPMAAIEQIAGLPDAGLPDYAALIGPRCRAVWLLTAGAESVDPGDADASPAQAALAAMHRSVGFEFTDQTFGHLDLPGREVDARTARAVVDALLGETGEVALRGAESPRRYVRTFSQCRDSATERPFDADALDNVVITGGSGAIGLQYARYCIERGARTVTLLSRNGLDQTALHRLTEGHDTEVRALRCDITDPGAVAAAARHAGAGASLLIHTAGIAETRSRADLTGADVAAVCAAKVRGLALLAQMWPLRPACRILACSSVFGVWGGYHHAAYAASNRMLDVLVAQLRARGHDCTAIRWGLWQAAGVVGADEITRTERSGLIAMAPGPAIAAGLHRYDGDPLIFDADFDRLAVFFESQGMPMPFSAPRRSDGAAGDPAARPLAEAVHAELAATLHLGDSVSIDPSAPLIDLGVDSLLALDLRKRLRRTVGRSVAVARMLGGITLDELIDALRAGSSEPPEGATPDAREARKVGLPA